MTTEYDRIGHNYSSLIKHDPLKNLVLHPGVLKLVGNVKGKRVLDMGCGDGVLSRAMVLKKASVVGFDIAQKQIEAAKSFKTKNARYIVSDQSFRGTRPFDVALCVMVLNYAPNLKSLRDFFKCAYGNLKRGGRFISVVFIAAEQDFGKIILNRRATLMRGRKIKIEFFNNTDSDHFTAIVYDFKKKDYEKTAEDAGFKKHKWVTLLPVPKNLGIMGKEFRKNYLKSKPYKALILEK